jgi:hypothetical protein
MTGAGTGLQWRFDAADGLFMTIGGGVLLGKEAAGTLC